jgi:hypothetical protein
MSTETRDKPLPTPHPDQPDPPGPIRAHGQAPQAEPPLPEREHPHDADFDSYADDVYMRLSQPFSEPDPALQSSSGSGDGPRALGENEPVAAGPTDRKKKQPRTSELFAALASGAAQGRPAGASPAERAVGPGWRAEQDHSESTTASRHSGPDHDEEPESGMTWLLLLLLSYASAVTLALFWVLWTGRTLHPPDPPPSNSVLADVESNPSPPPPELSQSLPPIPPENQTSATKTIRIGDLEITPLAIVTAPVDLVRLVGRAAIRREDTDSLVLRLRLTNVSNDEAFAPLDRALIRDQTSFLDRSQIVTSDGRTIGLFPLAVDSEWLIDGQEFPLLMPGESAETMVASEGITDDRLADEMTWRVRLRVGAYRTDFLAVRFTKGDITAGPARRDPFRKSPVRTPVDDDSNL